MRFLKIDNQLLLILLIQTIGLNLVAQEREINSMQPHGGGEYSKVVNGTCLNESKRQSILELIKENIQELELSEGQNNSRILAGDFEWPLKASSSLEFYDYHAISNFVDHDDSSGLLDYFCEQRSYDGHKGTDFIMWPFPWYVYENELVEVVAVLDGVIVGKEDGHFDANCSLQNNATWNAIYLMHDDGTTTWYGHLKENSLTAKSIGDSVTQGEYLGLVASSGFSDTPHLHFEVYDAQGELLDPYTGDCNPSESLWTAQREYREPTVNAIFTHSKEPELGCPTSNETPHFSNDFMVGDTVFFAAYFHDQLANDSYNYSIIDPDGNVWENWQHSSPATYNISWWYWYWLLPSNLQGSWRFRVEKNGEIYEHLFNYGGISNVKENETSESYNFFPNPTNNKIHILGKLDNIDEVSIFNTLGEKMDISKKWSNEIDLTDFSNGIYYVRILTDNNMEYVEKIIKH